MFLEVKKFIKKKKKKGNSNQKFETSRGGAHPSSIAYVATIQSQYEQSPRYKYSDPAVVLMFKVYQTTDSIHVETATLPGNSSTNREWAGVCLSLSEYHYGMSREIERGRERLLITAYNATSFSVYRPRWVKLSANSQDQNHLFLKRRRKSPHDSCSYVTKRQIWNDLLWAEYCLVSVHLYSLNMH